MMRFQQLVPRKLSTDTILMRRKAGKHYKNKSKFKQEWLTMHLVSTSHSKVLITNLMMTAHHVHANAFEIQKKRNISHQ